MAFVITAREGDRPENPPMAGRQVNHYDHQFPNELLVRHQSSAEHDRYSNQEATNYPISSKSKLLTQISTTPTISNKYSGDSVLSPPRQHSAITDSLDRLASGGLNTLTSTLSPPTGGDQYQDDTLVTDSNTLLNISSNFSDTSLATTTTADSLFQQGLAQLDANIARLEESLREAAPTGISVLPTNTLTYF